MTAKTKYIDVAETAKIIRTRLKSQFPETKFSVKSKRYAGGSSISIDWKDGAALQAVEEAIAIFQGKSFDGMNDITQYHKVDWVGEQVCFPHYVNCHRTYSKEFIDRAYVYCCDRFPSAQEQLKIVGSTNFNFDVQNYYTHEDLFVKAKKVLRDSKGDRLFDWVKESSENEEQQAQAAVVSLGEFKEKKEAHQLQESETKLKSFYGIWVSKLIENNRLSEIIDYHSWLTTHGEAVLEKQYKQFVNRCLSEGLIDQIVSFDFWKSSSGDNPGDNLRDNLES